MSQKFEGFIARISKKTGTNNRGPWTLLSVKIEKTDGTEYEPWISLGFDVPADAVQEGDYISLEAEEKDGRWKLVPKTLRKPKNPPARATKQRPQGSGGSSRGNYRGGGGGGNKFDGTGIQNRTNPIDAKRMGLSHARTSALQAVELLLGANALPLTKAGTKAGEAARYEEITAAIDKLTVKFFNDIEQERLLKTVADEGAPAPERANDLPDQEPDPEPEQDDDVPEDAEDDDAPLY